MVPIPTSIYGSMVFYSWWTSLTKSAINIHYLKYGPALLIATPKPTKLGVIKMKQSLIDCKAVTNLTSLSRSTIWRLEKAGKFPQRITLSNRCVRWPMLEVNDWITTKVEGRA